MNRSLVVLTLLLGLNTPVFAQQITVGDDGIVRCKDVAVGTTQTIGEVTYEVVDIDLLNQRRDEDADLTKVCVSNITNMQNLFLSKTFNQDISNWDVSNVTNMSRMFEGTPFNQPIGTWNVGKVTVFTRMFYGSDFNQEIGDWDVSSAIRFDLMFFDSDFNQPIGDWDLSNGLYINSMFKLSPFNQDISGWDVSSVVNMSGLFDTTPFDQDIRNWDVSNVTNMSFMFRSSPFNQDISDWDVSSLTSMAGMFVLASSFNQPIGNWNVSAVTDMSRLFNTSVFNQDISNWDVSSVKNMSFMFRSSPFNHDISSWDISSVTTMQQMFESSEFNQPIGNWNVSNVTNMDRLFSDATEFNQPINEWCVRNFDAEPPFFANNSPLAPENLPVWGTCPGLPSTITLESPSSNSVNIITTPTFIWNVDSNATTYQLYVYEGVEDVLTIDTLLDTTSFTAINRLEQNVTHSWKVRGINDNRGGLVGEWSSVWSFTTHKEPLSPSTPQIPFDGQENVGTITEFNWSKVDSVQSYHLQISTASTFSILVFESTEIDTNTYTLTEPLEQNSGYYWRVRSLGDIEERHSEWSDVLSFTTGVRTSVEDIVPTEYSLNQNYPNPFNPTTTISFSVPQSGRVQLEVYDVTGKIISRLVDSVMGVGTHTVQFGGENIPSGVYIYTLKVEGYTSVRKMLLVK